MSHKIELKEEVYDILTKHCIETYKKNEMIPADKLLDELMGYPEIPIHYPYHHFIMPAVLLTLAAIENHTSEEDLLTMLECAKSRSKNVLGGFCGFYGACGAAVGTGIFLSVYTDCSPMSETVWQWANEVTSISLQKISSVPGPRCCKRSSYFSLTAAIPYINEKLNLHLSLSDKISCKFHEANTTCKQTECPFYS